MTILKMPFFMNYKQYYKEVREGETDERTRLPIIHYELVNTAPDTVKDSFVQFCEERNITPIFYSDPLLEHHLEEQNEIMSDKDYPKPSVVEMVSRYAAEEIWCMENGRETSILDITEDLFDCYGYEFTGIDNGNGWSKDGGQTCILEEDDLFEVLEQTEELLRDEIELDFSKYDNQKVGIPYAIDFTVRRLPGKNISGIIISSHSGYCGRNDAYHDEMVLTAKAIRYKYDPVEKTKENPACKLAYNITDPSYQEMYSVLLDRMPRLLKWDLHPFAKDCSTVSFTVIYSDKSRKKNFLNMLKEEYDELEDVFSILQKLVPGSMNTKSLLLRKR